jgi:hypothetical protein
MGTAMPKEKPKGIKKQTAKRMVITKDFATVIVKPMDWWMAIATETEKAIMKPMDFATDLTMD